MSYVIAGVLGGMIVGLVFWVIGGILDYPEYTTDEREYNDRIRREKP